MLLEAQIAHSEKTSMSIETYDAREHRPCATSSVLHPAMCSELSVEGRQWLCAVGVGSRLLEPLPRDHCRGPALFGAVHAVC